MWVVLCGGGEVMAFCGLCGVKVVVFGPEWHGMGLVVMLMFVEYLKPAFEKRRMRCRALRVVKW